MLRRLVSCLPLLLIAATLIIPCMAMDIVTNGEAVATIVIPDEPLPVVTFAAEELAASSSVAERLGLSGAASRAFVDRLEAAQEVLAERVADLDATRQLREEAELTRAVAVGVDDARGLALRLARGDVLQRGDGGRLVGVQTRAEKVRNSDRCNDGDDRNNDHQFDERKALFPL